MSTIKTISSLTRQEIINQILYLKKQPLSIKTKLTIQRLQQKLHLK